MLERRMGRTVARMGKPLKERLLEKMNNIKMYLRINFVEYEMDLECYCMVQNVIYTIVSQLLRDRGPVNSFS